MDLARLLKRIEKLTIDNSPAILTALGVTGTLTTAYLTGKASIKAVAIVQTEQRKLDEYPKSHHLETRDMVPLVWKLYIPAAVTGALTISAILAANHVSTRRATAVAAAYSITEKAFTEYKEKVVEKIGEKKERAYRDEIAQERVERNPPNDNLVIITDNGEVLCHDAFSGRYFKSSMEAIQRAEIAVNHQILNDGYASLSDLYYLLELPVTAISEEVGWNTDRMLKIVYSTVLSPDNRPCISIDFDLHPNRKYSHFAGEG